MKNHWLIRKINASYHERAKSRSAIGYYESKYTSPAFHIDADMYNDELPHVKTRKKKKLQAENENIYEEIRARQKFG